MALRRPRIKAAALLVTKRKPRDKTGDSTMDDAEKRPRASANSSTNYEESKLTEIKECKYGGQLKDNVDTSLTNNERTLPAKGNSTGTNNGNFGQHSDEINEYVDTVNEKDEEAFSTESEANYQNGSQRHTNIPSSEESAELKNDYDAHANNDNNNLTETSFKCPASIEYAKSNISQNISNIDVFYTDMEETILKADMQRNIDDNSIAPSKQQGIQRIRPVPSLQRRNSFVVVGAASSVQAQAQDNQTTTETVSQQRVNTSATETTELPIPLQKMQPPTQRRERHYSASMTQSPLPSNSGAGPHHYTPHKFTPTMGLGRIRTESNCSAFSDSFVTATKIRKIDEHNNRSNHRKDFSCRLVNGYIDKASLKMFDLIYYNPTTNPMERRKTICTLKKESIGEEIDTKIAPTDSKEGIIDANDSNAMPVPQLKLNANGDLILDEKTLEIETTAEQEARKVLANSSLILLDENTGMNGFYRRQKRTKDWPPEETIKFYRCLQTVGTDFSLMCQLFPKRTRRDLKLKFKKEERTNLALINKALLYPKLFNIDDLKTQLETEEREKEEALQRWKEIQKQEAKTIKKIKIDSSKAARILKHGEEVYENENVVKRNLGRRSKTTENKKLDSIKKPKVTQLNNSAASTEPTTTQHITSTLSTKLPLKPKNNVAPVTTAIPQAPDTPSIKITNGPVKMEVVQVFETAVKAEQSAYDNIMGNSQISPNRNVTEMLEHPQLAEENSNYITSAPNSELCDEITDKEITTNHEMFMKIDAKSEADVKTFVNLDNGTVNTFEYEDDNDEDYEIMDTMPDTPASLSQHEIDECDMEQILMDLADGSLVLVSTLDPDNADQVVNEIYMIDKTTGELCEKPLDIPESIVQSVLSVMT
ncbi:uncharacterized protein Bdp1 [Eurosta solidaginis]|uniref:uncharacterized protein Bdp1 n=1 Tax=Eurosta solidaginis TaxID=178769 RepID=UPI0035314ABE